MQRKLVAALLVTFAAGLGAGVALAKKALPPSTYRDLDAAQAAENLLARARQEAGKGTWENLAIARVYYLSGDKEAGQAMIDRVTAGKMDDSDWLRLGRIYREAGEHERAWEAFAKAIAVSPKEEDLLSEVGTYYNLDGERERAEPLFDRAFAEAPEDFWVIVDVAGSYLGVPPGR